MHVPVLLKESLEYLNALKGKRFIDATAGTGGHTIGILKANPQAQVMAIDQDGEAVEQVKKRLQKEGLEKRAVVVRGNYADLNKIATDLNFGKADGIIFDLGFSSLQLDDPVRGFSFQKPGPLDMRYNLKQALTANEVFNSYPETKLSEIINKYGEEKFHRQIAHQIVLQRKISPISDTAEVFRLIEQSLPKPYRHKADASGRRVFQAIRIEVNRELTNLKQALPQTMNLLGLSGRLVVISFHSLEDRIVKQFFRQQAKDCVCPPEFPVCVCDKASNLRILTRKPITPSEQEMVNNPRSKSAKLRAAERI